MQRRGTLSGNRELSFFVEIQSNNLYNRESEYRKHGEEYL